MRQSTATRYGNCPCLRPAADRLRQFGCGGEPESVRLIVQRYLGKLRKQRVHPRYFLDELILVVPAKFMGLVGFLHRLVLNHYK